MTHNRDELGKAIKKIANSGRLRGHATWFHASNEFQAAMEVANAAEWAKVENERKAWDIKNIRKNPDLYPDCLADFCPDGAEHPKVIGIEVTELVDQDAINAHQELRRLAKAGGLGQISDAKRLSLLERLYPEWPLEKFRKLLSERAREKDLRSRDHRLERQVLLVLTDEPDLDEETLAHYMNEVQLPRLKNFDAVYLMASYVPTAGNDGHYPVFEIPIASA